MMIEESLKATSNPQFLILARKNVLLDFAIQSLTSVALQTDREVDYYKQPFFHAPPHPSIQSLSFALRTTSRLSS